MNSVKNFLNKSISKSSSKNMNIKSILYNRFVLYIFVFMAVINLMFFASTNDIGSLVTLLIVGFLTSFFSKNMIVILFISLVFTHILKYGTNISEGMEIENFDSIEGIENEKTDSTEGKKKTDSAEEKKNVDTTEEKKTPKKSSEPMSDKNDVPNVKSLQKDFENFQTVQEQILTGMKAIDPLLTKAENFILKFEKYKDREQFTNDDD